MWRKKQKSGKTAQAASLKMPPFRWPSLFVRPLNPASHTPNPSSTPHSLAIKRKMREVERRESNWAGRVKIGRTTGPFYNAVFRSPLSFSTEPQRTGSGHGDEAGKDEEDESEAHGGVEGWGVRFVDGVAGESEKRWETKR